MSERQIEAWLGRQVISMGCMYYKFVSPGNAGVPDRIIVLPGGIVVFVELKTEAGTLSPIQRRQMLQLKSRGAYVKLVYGLADAKKLAEWIRDVISLRMTE